MASKIIDGRVRVERVTELVVIECGGCGVLFGMEAEYQRQRREDGKGWHCPNGCERVYNKQSEADKLRAQLERERAAVNDAYDRLNREKASHAATKGQLTKTLKRVQNGVCPHCHRTFQQLARHMQSKHPVGKEG